MKIILVYIFLVGILLFGLIEILKVGEKITPPENISGEWEVDNAFAKVIEKNCALIMFSEKMPKLVIEQSGVYIKVLLNDSAGTVMNGKIKGDSLMIDETMHINSTGENKTVNTYEIILAAGINKEDKPVKMISGECRINGCSKPVNAKFVAVRQ